MTSLVTVQIETSMGSLYEFPDMDHDTVNALLTERAIGDMHRLGAITLANISKACIVVPSRIVSAIYVNGVEKWRSPVSIAQSE